MKTSVNHYQQSIGQGYQAGLETNPVKNKGKEFVLKQVSKSHLKLVSKSSEKLIMQKVQQKHLSNTSRLQNFIGGNSKQSTARKGLKIEIDNRLNKVYSHIVKHRSISLKPAESGLNKKINKQTLAQDQISSKMREKSDLESTTIAGQLPYELLRAYIQSIYEDYQIKDPLETIGKEFQVTLDPPYLSKLDQKTERITSVLSTPPKNFIPSKLSTQERDKLSTKKKILQLKRHFINELSMTENTTQKKQPLKLTTTKKINLESEFNVNPSPIGANTKRSPILQNRVSNNSSIHHDHPKLTETKFTTASTSLQKNYFRNYQSINLRTSQTNDYEFIAGNSRVEQHIFGAQNHIIGDKKINQTYRYCFICEASVLDANITFHEKQCYGLKKLLSDPELTQDRLLSMIESKIHKIKSQLESSFRQISKQNLNEQFSQIQDKTEKWITTLQYFKADLGQGKTQISSSEKDMTSLIHKTNIMQTFELINKLKWFTHLQDNFIAMLNK